MIIKLQGLGFYIGNFFIAYYGLMIIIGISIAIAIGWFQIKKYQLSFEEFILISAVGGLTGILFAKLVYIIVSWNQIRLLNIKTLNDLSSIMQGGFVYYGGLLGGLLGCAISHYLLKLDVKRYLNTLIPCLAIVHGFGRVGCALVGCCYGIPYSGMLSITYTESLFAPNYIPVFPVQLVEAISELLIASFLIFYINHLRGQNALEIYLLFYAIIRFALEFFRDDKERGVFGLLSLSQYISIILIIIVSNSLFTKRIP